jgi:homoserine kinase
MQRTATIRVPASTSNLGPGFDCLGIALQIYNDVTVVRGRAARLTPMMREAAKLFFKASSVSPFPFSVSIVGNIPPSRGLGSSVTVRLGVMHALNELNRRTLTRAQLFALCARLEGHPDNAAPAEFGGFNVARGLDCQQFSVSARLHFVLLIPNFEIATARARRVLPTRITRLGAVKSCANACAITAAFASRDYRKLRGAFADGLHQPFRKTLIPFLDQVIAAGERAGALGGFLSGSGSTIACLTLRPPEKVAAAMLAASPKGGARTLITAADNRGARILHSSLITRHSSLPR